MIIVPITITDEQKRILESWMGEGTIQAWLQHAIDDKFRNRVDASIVEHTAYNPKALSMDKKLEILKDITLPTRQQRDETNLKNLEENK
jgi:hypothetical protein